jgi:5'(3')-deoxyribonucleotidase
MKKIVYIDMDDTLADFMGAYEEARENNPIMMFPQAEYGFFANLQPLKDAVESVKILLDSEHFSPYILTAPSTINPLCYTEKRIWVEQHLGMEMVERLIISPDKSLLKGDYLVDDILEGKGQENFEGELIQFASSKYPGWHSVMAYLMKIA